MCVAVIFAWKETGYCNRQVGFKINMKYTWPWKNGYKWQGGCSKQLLFKQVLLYCVMCNTASLASSWICHNILWQHYPCYGVLTFDITLSGFRWFGEVVNSTYRIILWHFHCWWPWYAASFVYSDSVQAGIFVWEHMPIICMYTSVPGHICICSGFIWNIYSHSCLIYADKAFEGHIFVGTSMVIAY